MGGSAPKPPDPYKVSAAQTKENIATTRENARINAIDLYSPFGSTNWLYDVTDPRNAGKTDYVPTGQTLNFAPEILDFVNSQLSLSNLMAGRQVDQLNKLPTDDFSLDSIPDTSSIANTMFDRQMGLRKGEFDDAKTKLMASMAERGIPIGSEIWNNEMDRYERSKGELITGMTQDATLAASGEYQRLLSNALQVRRLPFDELALLQGTTPGVQQPGFANHIPVQQPVTDVAGNVWNAYNAELNAYNSQQQGMAGMLGGIGSLAGGFKSSEKFKEDFHPVSGEDVLERFEGLPVKDYRYKDLAQALFDVPEHRTGPMAEDWQREFGGDGETIDYASALGNIMAAVKALEERTDHLKPREKS